MSRNITVLNENNFDKFIEKGSVIIDFYADWCNPCKIMAPHFERASEEIKGVKFGKVNIEKNQDIAGRFEVMSIPTTILFKDKEQIERFSGAMSLKDIKEMAEKGS